jgi:hypothetical protein
MLNSLHTTTLCSARLQGNGFIDTAATSMSIHPQHKRCHQSIKLRGMSSQPLPLSSAAGCLSARMSHAVLLYICMLLHPALRQDAAVHHYLQLPALVKPSTSKGALAGYMAKHSQHTYPIPAAARRSAVPDPPKQQQKQAGSTHKHTSWHTAHTSCSTHPCSKAAAAGSILASSPH